MKNLLRNTRLFLCIYLTSSIDLQAGFARRAATALGTIARKRALAGATLAATSVAATKEETPQSNPETPGGKQEAHNRWLIRILGYNNGFGPQNHYGLATTLSGGPIEHDSVGILHKCKKGSSDYCNEGELVLTKIAVVNNYNPNVTVRFAKEHGFLSEISFAKGMRKEDADYIRERLQALNRYEKPYVYILNGNISRVGDEVKETLCEALLLEIRPEQPVEKSIPCHKDGETYSRWSKNPKHQGFIIVVGVSREELVKFLQEAEYYEEIKTPGLKKKNKRTLPVLVAENLPSNYEIVADYNQIVAIDNEANSTLIIPAPPVVITPDLMQGTAKIIKTNT